MIINPKTLKSHKAIRASLEKKTEQQSTCRPRSFLTKIHPLEKTLEVRIIQLPKNRRVIQEECKEGWS
jgi:hypothetical protein